MYCTRFSTVVKAAVIDGDAAGIGVRERGAGENDVGHVAHALIVAVGREDIILRAGDDLPRLLKIQQGTAHAVNKAVAGGDDAVINQQPAFVRLNRHGARADFGGLPCGGVALDGSHHVAVLAPEA